ncbi:MAG: MFS transporter, partial [Alphaproteobacteria bacterium]
MSLSERFTGLWRHANFRKLWAAQSLSAFGGRITRTAMPMIAIITLNSPESLIGLLSAAGLVPVAIAGLFGGGFVERSKKRRLMVALDLVRAALLLLIPIAAWLGALHIWLLFVCAGVAGAATALFQNADVAFLPRVVGRDQLLEGNSKLQMTGSVAEFVGPGLGGVLIQFLTAPFAIIFNVATYLWSAYWIGRIEDVVEAPAAEAHTPNDFSKLIADLGVGWRAVMTSPPLKSAFVTSSILQISWGFFYALYQLFVLRVLHLPPAVVGIIISCGGISGLIGAALTQPLVRRVGFGPAMAIS